MPLPSSTTPSSVTATSASISVNPDWARLMAGP
jgi:hypothetical protein